MGKFEKLVLLSVLFAAAVILAFSLNRKSGEVDAPSPLSGAQQVLDRANEPAPGLPETTYLPDAGQAPKAGETQPAAKSGESLLLNAGQDGNEPVADPPTKNPALSLEPVSDPNHRILVDATGLRPSFVDDYMVYVAAEGDTWSTLAQRFYGDGRFTRNLHQANDTFGDLKAGDQLLVPVFDFIARDAGLQSAGANLVGPSGAADPATTPGTTTPGTKPVDVAPGGSGGAQALVYEVKSGDTLSDISLAVFGTATRWKEILDANKDVLQKPEALQAGMKLKIPAGGKLPAAPAKGDAKPKTAQGPAKKVDPKKKRVL